jgi:hypothetical protein
MVPQEIIHHRRKKENRYCPPCNEELTSGIDVTVDLAWPIML